ncbi:MAG: class I SAM-dependent RNA methyltransferase [Rhizobiaceae bacterium]|nr:class I SAM-dependent RNA methyltransferase [Rhizobiaceae bacterium]
MPEITIEKLGRQGDGIFVENGKEIFVPATLPREVVKVSGKGQRRTLEEIVKPSTKRIDPVCKHFGTCGGCQLQHLEAATYQTWKTELLVEALARAGIEHKPDKFLSFPVSARRKAVFSAARIAGELHFGFTRQNSNEIVPIDECHVVVPALQDALPDLRSFVSSLPLSAKPVRISALVTANGLDVEVEELKLKSDVQQRALSRKALDVGFARLSFDGETVIEACKPFVQMGKAMVLPPPGGFLQASSEAEEEMASIVVSHLSGAKKVADLYCGVGTFALRLAEGSQVWALEDSTPAIASLDLAWRGTAGNLKQISSEVRNLERRPASFKELKRFEGLVFDPPRAGAELQSRQIAKSRVGKVAAVSCNPITLARDLSILLEGGYAIKEIVAIDQFRFTYHLETIVLLEK